jgi:filamentous hemagglutinin family protein
MLAPWVLGLGLLLLAGGEARAQVVLDGTAGPAGALAGPDFRIGAELGTRSGRNLFHSFERFGLRSGESATFSGPDAIRHVVGRVTGGDRSEVDGTLRSTIPGAALWLINPAGVLFGPNASLDLQGSFHVSTADELRFVDGARFSARAPSASTFTTAAPEAFGFLGAPPGAITVDRSLLQVPTGQALSLVGGDITIQGDAAAVDLGGPGTLHAEAGRINLAAASGQGRFTLSNAELDAEGRAIINLRDQALVDVSGDGGGAIRIQGGTVALQGGAFVFAGNEGDAPDLGGISVDAGLLTVSGDSAVATFVLGQGRGGILAITADRVHLTNGGHLSTGTLDSGDAGPLLLNAREVEISSGGRINSHSSADGSTGLIRLDAGQVRIEGFGSGIFSQAFATGDAERVDVRASDLEILNHGKISSDTRGEGDAGGVSVFATGRLIVIGDGSGAGFTGISSESTFLRLDDGRAVFATGDAGPITIRAGEMEVRRGAWITSSTYGPGNAAPVTVEAGRLLVAGDGLPRFTGIFSSPSLANVEPQDLPSEFGHGGDVLVRAIELEIGDGGEISSSTFNDGDAGNVTVEATHLRIIGGTSTHSGIFSESEGPFSEETGGGGRGGNLLIRAGTLEIGAGGSISSSTRTSGDAGSITLEAERLRVDGEDAFDGLPIRTGIFTSAAAGTGEGGPITVRAGEFELRRGGQIASITNTSGDTGTITITAGRFLVLGGDPRLFTGVSNGSNPQPGATGNAGAVVVVADALELREGGRIDSSTTDAGLAGSIAVRADQVRLVGRGSGIASYSDPHLLSAGAGPAGNVTVVAKDILMTGGAALDSSATGSGGAGAVHVEGEQLVIHGSQITTSSASAGGGAITIEVWDLIDLHTSEVTTSVAGGTDPTAGNISIDPTILIIDGSRIQANAPEGFGGNLTIVADNILVPGGNFEALLARGDIDASGGAPERAGTIVVDAPEVDLSGGLVVLEGGFVDAGALLRPACVARRDVGASSLTGVGRGGLPPSPDAPLGAPVTLRPAAGCPAG